MKPKKPERTFDVIFKAGFEVHAASETQAKRKAKQQLGEELVQSGASFFIIDVTPTGVAR